MNAVISRGGGVWISFLAILLIASSTFLFSFGAPAARTGAPGESTCVDGCHVSFPLNSGGGSVTIQAPAEYTPGETFNVTVSVADPDAAAFGFEITAKDASEVHVGSWDVSDDAVQFAGGSTEYVTHHNAPFSSQSFSWIISWTAPGTDVGNITFYAAGNGADGGGEFLNDRIYSTSLTVSPRGPTAAEETDLPIDFAIASVFPNPFVDRATIVFSLSRAAEVSLDLFDALGRKLSSKKLGLRPPGQHEWMIVGNRLPTGVIFYRLRAGRNVQSGLLILTR
ncbi:MAG: hypothetical protein IH853_06290 [Bacteroidetes bacterium]|nr:hypothetical protein [Bacteroidota bacterium]